MNRTPSPSLRVAPEQIALYQTHALLTHEICRFDPTEVVSALQSPRRVMAIDLGGDKLRSASYEIGDGSFHKLNEEVFQSRGGAGYLARLERLAAKAADADLAVGISSATKLDGSVIARTVNLPLFFQEFRERYGADYENLFPGRSFVANDTITGICGSVIRLAIDGIAANHIGFVICASGLGASVISDRVAIHVEIGHVPLVDALNPLGQVTPCGVEGRAHVCVERVAAARAGIEDIFRQHTGERVDGIALAGRYEAGDALATTLYESSALALAHAIAGMMERYAFPNSERSVVVLHGGNFEIASYRKEIARDLAAVGRSGSRLAFSRDLSTNVCLDGAAVLAVTHGGRL